MKKLLVLAALGFLFLNVQGQWYSRQFNVNSIDDLSQAQLNYALQRAEANLKAGKILTLSGVGAFTVGTIIAAAAFSDFWNWDDSDTGLYVTGGMLMFLGMGSTAVGIPFWTHGATRRNKVEVALIKFNTSAVSGFRQPAQLGLCVNINF